MRRRRVLSLGLRVWSVAILTVISGCDRPAAGVAATAGSANQATLAPRSGPAPGRAPGVSTAARSPVEGDPVVAAVDFGAIRASDVRARIDGAGDDAILRAVGAAVLDELALRELRVIGHGPTDGESRSQAVDRLLPQVFGGADCTRVDSDALRLRFLEDLSRWRHPRSWTVWEAYLPCCATDSCDVSARNACMAATAEAAHSLRAAAVAEVAPVALAAAVSEGSAWPLATSPARDRAVPAFEALLAQLPAKSPHNWTLRRYTFFGRGDRRFPETSFRRVEAPFEAAITALSSLSAITPPVELDRGWSVAMLVAHEPARWSLQTDADVVATLRQQVCATLVQQDRDAWLERIGAAATVRWESGIIESLWGANVRERLPVWSRTERLRQAAPAMPAAWSMPNRSETHD